MQTSMLEARVQMLEEKASRFGDIGSNFWEEISVPEENGFLCTSEPIETSARVRVRSGLRN